MLSDSLPATVWKEKQLKIKETRHLDVLPKSHTEVYCEVKVTYGKAWTGEILVGLLVGGAKLQLPSVEVAAPMFFRRRAILPTT